MGGLGTIAGRISHAVSQTPFEEEKKNCPHSPVLTQQSLNGKKDTFTSGLISFAMDEMRKEAFCFDLAMGRRQPVVCALANTVHTVLTAPLGHRFRQVGHNPKQMGRNSVFNLANC